MSPIPSTTEFIGSGTSPVDASMTSSNSELRIGTGTTRYSTSTTSASAAPTAPGFHTGLSTGYYIAIPCISIVLLAVIGAGLDFWYRHNKKAKQEREKRKLELESLNATEVHQPEVKDTMEPGNESEMQSEMKMIMGRQDSCSSDDTGGRARMSVVVRPTRDQRPVSILKDGGSDTIPSMTMNDTGSRMSVTLVDTKPERGGRRNSSEV